MCERALIIYLKLYFIVCMIISNPRRYITLKNRPWTSTNVLVLLYIKYFINISTLQSYFNELEEFLSNFPNPSSIILLSETCINVDPQINIDVPDYLFFHIPSPTKAGGVGVYVSKHLNITINDSLSLNVHRCDWPITANVIIAKSLPVCQCASC